MEAHDSESMYYCPGETLPITKSLHLARLARGFSACADCIHRCETATLPKEVVDKLESNRNRLQVGILDQRLFEGENLRGIYLNELNRSRVEHITEHVLSTLCRNARYGFRPKIIVAHDWRPSSPDLVIGVVSALRRWGCDIVDMGQTNRPCFDMAMATFPADLGMFVTGGIEAEKFNGIDILSSNGMEWCAPGHLSEIIANLHVPASRAQRSSGDFQTISLIEEYEGVLAEQFPQVDSLRVSLACCEPLTLQILGALLLKHGCEVNFHELNTAESKFNRQVEKFRYEVRDAHVDIGLLIRPDSRAVSFIDERGKRVPQRAIMSLLASELQIEILESDGDHQPSSTAEASFTKFQNSNAEFMSDRAERYWFKSRLPQSDAIHAVGAVLNVLSKFQTPLSVLSRAHMVGNE